MKKITITLGVTGSIAAYKAADLCSKLTQANFNVVVIMTESAKKLITEQTFLTLSKNPVISDLWNIPEWQPGHIALAEKSELLIVAPATANFIGKFTHGIADDALSTYALSHNKKVMIAPAMNPKMWKNSAVQDNIELLKTRGIKIIGPGVGKVACGDDGEGRLESVSTIFDAILAEKFNKDFSTTN